MCIEETLPRRVPEVQESKIAVSAEPFGRPFTSQLLSVWKKKVKVSTPRRVE